MSTTVVAIDGPAGAGKSSVASALANMLGFTHVNTGSLYRAVAWAARKKGVSIDPVEQSFLDSIKFEFKAGKLLVDGDDPGDALRSSQCAADASFVAKQAAVRAFLLPVQRQSAEKRWIVMEGRDIGTVIFPDAAVKIFLTASAFERARRRMIQGEVPAGAAIEDVQKEIEARDLQDSTRAVSPLKAAADAVTVDSSGLTLEETVETIAAIVRKKRAEAGV
ncbi:MAG: (d)CMP kinase [Lentisphaeria bacterium]|nr:(d)CMP kinase [Lentisphaeria bacterium]